MDEFALNHVDADAVRAWSKRHFVSENAVLIPSGAPADDLWLELGHGQSLALPEPTRIAGLDLPTCIAAGYGAVAAGFLVERGPATGVALAALAERLTVRLRHELGLSYGVWTDYEPFGERHAHLTIAADCTDDGVEQVIDAMLHTLDQLADHGPDAQDVAHEVERFQRMLEHAARCGRLVRNRRTGRGGAGAAGGVRSGDRPRHSRGCGHGDRQRHAEHADADSRRPSTTAPISGLPLWSERAVSGRIVRPGGVIARVLSRKGGLVLGEEGISGLWGDGTITHCAMGGLRGRAGVPGWNRCGDRMRRRSHHRSGAPVRCRAHNRTASGDREERARRPARADARRLISERSRRAAGMRSTWAQPYAQDRKLGWSIARADRPDAAISGCPAMLVVCSYANDSAIHAGCTSARQRCTMLASRP